jgi:hypothetical protein
MPHNQINGIGANQAKHHNPIGGNDNHNIAIVARPETQVNQDFGRPIASPLEAPS